MNSYRVHASHGQKIGDVSFGFGIGRFPHGRTGRPARFGEDAEPVRQCELESREPPIHPRHGFVQSGGERIGAGRASCPGILAHRPAAFRSCRRGGGNVKILYRPASWASTQFSVGYSNRHNLFVAVTNGIDQENARL